MSVTRMPSGRWRSQVYQAGKNVSVQKIIGGPASFPTKTAAKQARAKAREALKAKAVSEVTVRGFWERWTTDPLFARPKVSTDLHNRERTKGFVEKYGQVLVGLVGDEIVDTWVFGLGQHGTVPALRAMFNDAASAKGGRLVQTNPFTGLRLPQTRGLKETAGVHP